MKHLFTPPLILTTFLVATASLFSAALFGQQPAQSNMTLLARALVAQIPDINGEVGKPDEVGEHLFRCTIQELEGSSATLQVYRYKRPAAPTDLALVAYDIHDFPIASFLKCFALDHKTGALEEVDLPFEIAPPYHFNRDEFDEDHGYWRTGYHILDNGNVLISGSPGMSCYCVMVARWDGKGNFTLFKRASYDIYVDLDDNNPETERYIQNVVRPNFQRINAISTWEYIEEGENRQLSTEGATITYYYSADGLEKAIAKRYDETGAKTVEYYFHERKLSFIYDVTTLRSGAKTERRWYFKGNNCIRGLGDNGAKPTSAQLEEDYSLFHSIIGLY